MACDGETELVCWSDGQKTAFNQLVQLAETFFEPQWAVPGTSKLRPRFDSLVVGASGTGKSHLVRTVSRTLGVPVLRISYAEWIVSASRETPHTLERVYKFAVQHPRGIVHIDEMDKFRSLQSSDWSISVMVELFLLLDRSLQQPVRDLIWTEDLLDRLSSSFLFIGTGTWQAIWSDFEKPAVGFRSEVRNDSHSIQQEIIKRAIIPTELLRRFRSSLIVLPPPLEGDYYKAAESFGIEELATRLGVRLDYSEARASALGARWLEEKLADLLCIARKERISISAESLDVHPEDDSEDDFDVSDLL